MSVYCDTCGEIGSPNDEAGFTPTGGWHCPTHRQAPAMPPLAAQESVLRTAAELAAFAAAITPPTEAQRTRVGCNYDGRLRVIRNHLDDGDVESARRELRELLDVLTD
jgi:hypothetical protein